MRKALVITGSVIAVLAIAAVSTASSEKAKIADSAPSAAKIKADADTLKGKAANEANKAAYKAATEKANSAEERKADCLADGGTWSVSSWSCTEAPAEPTGIAGREAAAMRCLNFREVKSVNLSDGFMSTADIYTSVKGDLFSASGEGRQVVAKFQRCAQTEDGDGYVSVYSASGELIANGSY